MGQEGAETLGSAAGVSLLARALGCADPGSCVLAALGDCGRERGADSGCQEIPFSAVMLEIRLS